MAFLVERCGEMVVSMDQSHKPVPAPFLTKTYQLVDDPCTDHIVSWGEDDTTFVVWRPLSLLETSSPTTSSTTTSQALLGNSTPIKIVADRWEFANEFFKRGAKHLLSEIHRRKSSQPSSHHYYHSPPPPPLPPPSYNHHNHHPEDHMSISWINDPSALLPPPAHSNVGHDHNNASEFLSALSEDNQRLRRRNSVLLSELTHMKKLYNDIIYFLQNHVTPISPRPSNCSSRILELGPSTQYHPPHPPHPPPPPLYRIRNCAMEVAEEEEEEEEEEETDGGAVKLFGVPIHGKKRLHEETATVPDEESDDHGSI
uniref:HSF-type DNA-binding domain-containing protein n=1 Tax=Ananas comosus var. bracteatus TaxID=296719 RepID=A0A6V7PSK0_ANACO|nr:unnamed protein product [Ananas comosus var. bracteatus]